MEPEAIPCFYLNLAKTLALRFVNPLQILKLHKGSSELAE